MGHESVESGGRQNGLDRTLEGGGKRNSYPVFTVFPWDPVSPVGEENEVGEIIVTCLSM